MISVRSVADAVLAIHSGVDIIDIKEPRRGALGMPDVDLVQAIAREVPPHIPLGLALGEFSDWWRRDALPEVPEGISYLKVGLAEVAKDRRWRDKFRWWRQETIERNCLVRTPRWVAVAYGDWQTAGSPSPADVLDFAREGFSALLLDTLEKGTQARGLFDCLSPTELAEIAHSTRALGLELAVSGSLKLEETEAAAELGADIVGLRGAVCVGGRRESPLDPERVDRVRALLERDVVAL